MLAAFRTIINDSKLSPESNSHVPVLPSFVGNARPISCPSMPPPIFFLVIKSHEVMPSVNSTPDPPSLPSNVPQQSDAPPAFPLTSVVEIPLMESPELHWLVRLITDAFALLNKAEARIIKTTGIAFL